MEKLSKTSQEPKTQDTNQYLVEEAPDLQPSIQQERDHTPDNYTTGYDPDGDTRVGIGGAGGDATKLIRHNEGRHRSDGNHSAREAARDKKRITQSFCSVLDLTSLQQREAVAAMGSLNLDRFGRQKRLEKVALGTIKVIVEWDRFHRRLQNVNVATLDEERLPDRMLDNDEYCALLEENEVSRKDLYSISQLVKRELKKRNHFGPASSESTGATAANDPTTTQRE